MSKHKSDAAGSQAGELKTSVNKTRRPLSSLHGMRRARAELVRKVLGEEPSYRGWLSFRLCRQRDYGRQMTPTQLDTAIDDLAAAGEVDVDVPGDSIRVVPMKPLKRPAGRKGGAR